MRRIARKTISWRKPFVCPQKGNRAFFWTCSFDLCILSAHFQSWNAKLWSWKPPHDERAPAICWWMTFTEVSNPFLLPPSKWLTIRLLWGRGYGWFSSVRIFSPTYNGVRFLFQHYSSWGIFFFQCRILFFPGISLQAFFSSKSVCRIFFPEITHNPLKSQMVGP